MLYFLNVRGKQPYAKHDGYNATTRVDILVYSIWATSCSNTVAIAILFSKKLKRKAAHYFIINLATSDLIVSIVAIPIYIYVLKGEKRVQEVKFVFRFVDVLAGLGSLFSITAIAIERLFAVMRPMKYRVLRKKYYMLGIMLTWIGASIVGLINLLSLLEILSQFGPSMHLVFTCTTLVIPVVMTSLCYVGVCLKMRNHSIVSTQCVVQQHEVIEKVFTRPLLLVTIIFFLTWLSFLILNAIPSKYVRNFSYNVIFFLKFLHYANYFANPVVYTLRMPDFRQEARNAICRKTGTV